MRANALDARRVVGAKVAGHLVWVRVRVRVRVSLVKEMGLAKTILVKVDEAAAEVVHACAATRDVSRHADGIGALGSSAPPFMPACQTRECARVSSWIAVQGALCNGAPSRCSGPSP